MSTTRDVDLGGVHVTGSWNSPGGLVEAQLAVYTKSGQARIAIVDERQLIQLIAQAAEALQQLRTHRELDPVIETPLSPTARVMSGVPPRVPVVVEKMCERTGCTKPHMHMGGHGA